MTNFNRLYVLVVLACLVFVQPIQSKPLAGHAVHFVSKVIDGDTLILGNGEHVRLLGINTPELARKNNPGEAGGKVAHQWLKNQVEHRRVNLIYDRLKKDKYGRLLAHVFTREGTHINLTLVAKGYAIASIIPPNMLYTSELLSAQQVAFNAGLGIWDAPGYKPVDIDKVLNNYSHGWKRMLAIPASVVDNKHKDKNYIRLIINNRVDIRIPRSHSNYFPEISTYLGQKLEVRGWVSRRDGHVSILVRHPSALVRLGAD